MAKIATKVMLGARIADMGLKRLAVPHYGVKESVFPFNMFPEVDPVLGPEMRSTGEVLGMADSFGLAFYKAQEATQQRLPKGGCVLITVADSDKDAVADLARQFLDVGFTVKATEGTVAVLAENGVEAEKIAKLHEGRPNIVDAIVNGEIQLVVNTPIGRRSKHDDSYIRKSAIRQRVPYITTMAAAQATVKGIAAAREGGDAEVKSLQSYHADIG
jgi:carbamoyl-phosphate synthase large subunit